MKFIPSRTFTVYSCLSFDEVKNTLSNQTTESVFDKRHCPFISNVGEGHFEIYKVLHRESNLNKKSGFNLITIGTKNAEDDHIIHIEQRFHPITLALFYIECIIGMILFLTAIVLTIVAPQSLFMDLVFLPLVALCVLAGYMSMRSFARQTEYTKRELFKLIKAVQINSQTTPLTEEHLIF